MAFPRQENWSGLPFPPPGDLPDPGVEFWFPALQADSLPSEPPGKAPETPKSAAKYCGISRRNTPMRKACQVSSHTD